MPLIYLSLDEDFHDKKKSITLIESAIMLRNAHNYWLVGPSRTKKPQIYEISSTNRYVQMLKSRWARKLDFENSTCRSSWKKNPDKSFPFICIIFFCI